MTPHEEMESQLTALLLGELPEHEATALRESIAVDPELAQLHDRLKQTIGLVREAAVSPAHDARAGADAPKLSVERREQLLTTFKTVCPRELQKPARSTAPRRELFALAAMIVALLAVGALVIGRIGEHGKVAEYSLARREAEAESPVDQKLEKLKEELVVKEMRSAKIPAAPPVDPATGLPSFKWAESKEMASDLVVHAPANAPKQVADLPTPSWPASETPTLALVPQTPPPAAQPLPADTGFRSVPDRAVRRSNIALPTVEDAISATIEGDANSQLVQTRFGERQFGLADDFSQMDWFGRTLSNQNGDAGRSSGGVGGGRGRTPVAAGTVPAESQRHWNFAGAEYAGVGGAGSISAPTGAVPLPSLQNPVSQSIATPTPNLKGIQLKDADLDGAVVVTNSVVVGARFADATTQLNDSFVSGLGGFGGVGGLGGVIAQSQDGRNQSQFDIAPIDSLGSVSSTTPGMKGGADANRYYSFSGVANNGAVDEQKPQAGDDAAKRDRKLAELSKDKKSGMVTDGTVLAFDVQAGKPLGAAQKEMENQQFAKGDALRDAAAKDSEQEVLEKRYREASAQGERSRRQSVLEVEQAWAPPSKREPSALRPDAAPKSRVDIALPQVEHGEAVENFRYRVASGPVVNREAMDLTLAVSESARRSVEDKSGVAALTDGKETLRRKLESIELPEIRFDSLPLAQVLDEIAKETRKQDPANRGVNLLVTTPKDSKPSLSQTVDPATGLPVSRDASETTDLARAAITIDPPLRNVTLGEALKAIAKASDRPINLSLEDYAVVFSAGDKKNAALSIDDAAKRRTAPTAPIPQPEVFTADNTFSTFSLNVSDVSFKLAAASVEKGQMPDPATVRSEEFINAFDYRDPEPAGRAPIAFAWERARYPFAHDRDLVRLSVKTAASGRQPGRPLNLVLLLDNSGSMERADRLRIRQECLRVLAGQLRPEDRVSVVAFARTARLWVDGLPGARAGELSQRVGGLTPEGGTNLEDAMNLAYQTALRHFQANGVNRVVLLTDGAANLGDVEPESLKKKVEGNRRQGVALDCFGLGWDGYNDDLLETLSRNGDGRYGFINTPEAAASDFAGQLAGALKVSASDVKVQVEWNPRRVTAYRQIGYAKHQLKKEQFRDNTVDAAEIGAAEAGNALYVVQVNAAGEGPLGTMRVRFKVPGTGDYREHAWPLPYEGASKSLEQSSPALRLAASASAFSEWLVSSPFAAEVTPDRLLGYLSGVPEASPADPRPKKLEWMIRQAKSLAGK